MNPSQYCIFNEVSLINIYGSMNINFGDFMPKKSAKKTTKKTTTKKETKVEQIQKSKSPINHFEIPFDDLGRIKKFYGEIFAWDFEDVPEMEYTMVYTDKMDKKNMPTTPGVVNGGFTKRNPIQEQPTLVMTVNNIHLTTDQIKKSGGELLGELLTVGDMGFYHLFKDPEGNVMGVFQPLQRM